MRVRRLLISLLSIAVLASTVSAFQNGALRGREAVPIDTKDAAAPVTEKTGLRLTTEERAWLARHQTIRVAFDGYFPPYSFLNDDNEMEGLAVDVLRVLAQRTGVTIELSPKAVWKDLFEAAQRREVDVVATMGRQPERLAWFIFTRPYIFKSLVIMTREETTGINGPQDLAGKRVALVEQYQYVYSLLNKYPSIKPYSVNTMLDGLNAVAVGKADAAITFLGAGHYLQTKYQIANLKFAAVFDRDRFTESIAVRKDWPELASIFDKALASMTDDEMAKLSRPWVGPEYKPGIEKRTVFKYLAVMIGLVLLLVSAFMIWNRALKREVNRKTVELQKELAERKKTEQELEKHREQLEVLVKERTAELRERNAELERMNRLFVGRELRMTELKERIAVLERRPAETER